MAEEKSITHQVHEAQDQDFMQAVNDFMDEGVKPLPEGKPNICRTPTHEEDSLFEKLWKRLDLPEDGTVPPYRPSAIHVNKQTFQDLMDWYKK